jgi:uracil phosphoribosyltransferase
MANDSSDFIVCMHRINYPRPPGKDTSKDQSMKINVVDHPLIQHKLTLMRRKDTSVRTFRELVNETAMLLGYEITRDLDLTMETIETPLETMEAPLIEGKKLCFVSILRAGNGLLDGLMRLMPSVRVGHVGLYRDPKSLVAVEYYFKVPTDIGERLTIVVDPMLATANSSIAAVDKLKEGGAKNMKFLCLLAAPEGVRAFNQAHPDVELYTAAVDRQLNENGYILPGLGDAGDRIYGTK